MKSLNNIAKGSVCHNLPKVKDSFQRLTIDIVPFRNTSQPKGYLVIKLENNTLFPISATFIKCTNNGMDNNGVV